MTNMQLKGQRKQCILLLPFLKKKNFNRPEHDKAHDNEFYVMHDRIVHVNPK